MSESNEALAQISYELNVEKPIKLKQSLKIAEESLKAIGVPISPKVRFSPRLMVAQEVLKQDLKTDALAHDFAEHGIKKSPLFTAGAQYAAVSIDKETYILSTEDYAKPFIEEVNMDAAFASFGAIDLFAGIAHLALEEASKEIQISSNFQDREVFIKDADRIIDNEVNESPDPSQYVEVAQTVKDEIYAKDGLEITGKGAALLLKLGPLVYTKLNNEEHATILNYIHARAEKEFIKRMSKECKWFVTPDNFPPPLKALYDSKSVGPSIEELGSERAKYSFRQLVAFFLESRYSKEAFESRFKAPPLDLSGLEIVIGRDADLQDHNTQELLEKFGHTILEVEEEVLVRSEYKEEFDDEEDTRVNTRKSRKSIKQD